MFEIYRALLSVVVWLVLVPVELLRILLGRASGRELRERLGLLRLELPLRPARLLVHAVSVGEMAAAEPLLTSLAARVPDLSVVLTAGNRDGMRAAQRLEDKLAFIESVAYLPWDRPGAVGRWLARIRPCAVAVIETEIWPGLFSACREAGIPLCLASGRLRPRDVARYRLARPLLARTLECCDWIGVQSEAEARRFEAIGAPPGRTRVLGNLKWDASLSEARLLTGPDALPGEGLLLVGGSTHAPEETQLLDAFLRLRESFPGLRLVLAPRAASRAGRIAREAERRALRVALWPSEPGERTEWDVLVAAETGWLARLYAWADVAFVGGSLANRGGHNPLEPALHAKPIVVGPNTEHFEDIVGRLEQAGALVRVPSREAIRPALSLLLADPARRASMGRAARRVVEEGRGVSGRYAEILAKCLRLGDAEAAQGS